MFFFVCHFVCIGVKIIYFKTIASCIKPTLFLLGCFAYLRRGSVISVITCPGSGDYATIIVNFCKKSNQVKSH